MNFSGVEGFLIHPQFCRRRAEVPRSPRSHSQTHRLSELKGSLDSFFQLFIGLLNSPELASASDCRKMCEHLRDSKTVSPGSSFHLQMPSLDTSCDAPLRVFSVVSTIGVLHYKFRSSPPDSPQMAADSHPPQDVSVPGRCPTSYSSYSCGRVSRPSPPGHCALRVSCPHGKFIKWNRTPSRGPVMQRGARHHLPWSGPNDLLGPNSCRISPSVPFRCYSPTYPQFLTQVSEPVFV